MTDEEIALVIHRTPAAIARIRKSMGYKRSTKTKQIPRQKVASIIEMFISGSKTQKQIAKETGVSEFTIGYLISKYYFPVIGRSIYTRVLTIQSNV